MSRLGQEPDVIALASELGLAGRGDPVEAIVGYCLDRIGGWLDEEGPVSAIGELESLAARRLGLVFEDVWKDDDLDRVIAKYVRLGEGVFKFLRVDLDGTTFGATYRRSKAASGAPDRLVAVIATAGGRRGRGGSSPAGTRSPTSWPRASRTAGRCIAPLRSSRSSG